MIPIHYIVQSICIVLDIRSNIEKKNCEFCFTLEYRNIHCAYEITSGNHLYNFTISFKMHLKRVNIELRSLKKNNIRVQH